jgi:hypothetical protein
MLRRQLHETQDGHCSGSGVLESVLYIDGSMHLILEL